MKKNREEGLSFFSISLLISFWAVIIALGMLQFYRYETREGAKEVSNKSWPEGTSLSYSKSKFSWVMGIHPKCPCSLATVGNLERLFRYIEEPFHITALVRQDPLSDESKSKVVRRLSKLPQVSIFFDERGETAAKFGMLTSGDSRIYNRSGELIFAGGITINRSHEGWSPGASLILEQMSKGSKKSVELPVFGCNIQDRIR